MVWPGHQLAVYMEVNVTLMKGRRCLWEWSGTLSHLTVYMGVGYGLGNESECVYGSDFNKIMREW